MFDLEQARKSIIRACDEAQVDWGYDGTRKVAEEFVKNKSKLMNLMRKHPQWNEDAAAIILKERVKKVPDEYKITKLLEQLFYSVNKEEYPNGDGYVSFPYGLSSDNQITEEDVECIQTIVEHGGTRERNRKCYFGERESDKPKVGMKKSRYMRKVFMRAGLNMETGLDFNRFARYADEIAIEGSTEENIIISVNPGDILLQSYGTDWASCHILNPDVAITNHGDSYSGCYRAGTLSYATDSCTIMVFKPDPEWDGDPMTLQNVRREYRQLFHINMSDRIILQARLYPYGGNDYRHEELRKIMQEVFSVIWDVPNYWKNKKDTCDGFSTTSDALHYKDYRYDSYGNGAYLGRNISYLPGTDPEHADIEDIGNISYCLDCGRRIYDESEIYCEHCAGGGFTCAGCGECIDEDDAFYCEDTDDYRCADCSFTCYDCGHTYSREETEYRYYNDEMICENCFEEDYTSCSECGEVIRIGEEMSLDDEIYCDYCFDKLTFECGECRERYMRVDQFQVGDEVTVTHPSRAIRIHPGDDAPMCGDKAKITSIRHSVASVMLDRWNSLRFPADSLDQPCVCNNCRNA